MAGYSVTYERSITGTGTKHHMVTFTPFASNHTVHTAGNEFGENYTTFERD